MNRPMSGPRGGPPSILRYSLIALATTVLLGALAISNDSFWLDECITAARAREPRLADCWRLPAFSELQLPLHMLYLWSCAQVFGVGEWTLRASGLPWFVAGLFVFALGMRNIVRSAIVPGLLAALSAFSWYYLNEAKVYSSQLGCALALTGAAAALWRRMQTGEAYRNWWRVFLLSAWALSGMSVLAMFWAFFLVATFVVMIPGEKRAGLLKLSPIALMACLAGLFVWAAYYAWTFTVVGKPTAVGTTTPQTMVFVFYELLGFAGLGPGRNDLREAGVSALKPFLIPLSLFAALMSVMLIAGFKEARARFGTRRLVTLAALASLPLVVLFAYGIVTRFRVLGRHATPLLPLFILMLSFGLIRLLHGGKAWAKGIVFLFVVAWLGSSLIVRFAERHRKDDYRGAVQAANAAASSGKTVWWSADNTSAAFYRLAPEVRLVINPYPPESLPANPAPDLIIASKPDTFDGFGVLRKYLLERGYRTNGALPAFTFWIKGTEP